MLSKLTSKFFGSSNERQIKKYKPIKIQNVVKAILHISKNVSDKIVFESDELERIAKSN